MLLASKALYLYPLTSTSFTLTYTHKHPLQFIATRYVDSTSNSKITSASCTLVLIPGISLCQETWIPVIKQLYRLNGLKRENITAINSAWVVERPNHGNAGLLNAKILAEHYRHRFPTLEYAAAIRTFLASNILSKEERSHLIGIGHSGGGGALIQALEPAKFDFPLSRLILVATPLCDRSSWPHFLLLNNIVRRSNARRRTTWTSKEEVMHWFKTHPPWSDFHLDVLHIIFETYFVPDAQNPGSITTKTTVEQETAAFMDDGSHLDAFLYLRTILHLLPTHLIQGSVKDIWPSTMYAEIQQNVEKERHILASVTTIKGVGHYIPVTKPNELGQEIFSILYGQSSSSQSVRTRL